MDLKGILGDLLTLEVNTVIKDGLTANKMPPLPFALLDIIAAYANCLRGFGLNLAPYFELDRDRLWLALDEQAQRGEAKAKKLVEEAERAYQATHDRAPAQRGELFNYLTDLWPVLEQPQLPGPSEHRWFSMEEVSNGWESFERLRIAANQAMDFREFDKADVALLMRVVGNCSRLKFIVQGIQREGEHREAWTQLIPATRNQLLMGDMHQRGVPLDKLGTQHQAAVRKIWELGTERIVAQTCIQVDGDVLTRISPALLEKQTEVVRGLILEAHRRSIGTSLSYWKLLIEVAQRLGSRLRGR
jgi:hypothetical protein